MFISIDESFVLSARQGQLMSEREHMRAELEKVREWADAKIASASEPPWAWYQYMKLVETVDAILAGMDAVTPTGSLQQSEKHRGTYLRLVGSTSPRDDVQLHPSDTPVRLPT
jgi:hypothetical protein